MYCTGAVKKFLSEMHKRVPDVLLSPTYGRLLILYETSPFTKSLNNTNWNNDISILTRMAQSARHLEHYVMPCNEKGNKVSNSPIGHQAQLLAMFKIIYPKGKASQTSVFIAMLPASGAAFSNDTIPGTIRNLNFYIEI